MDPLFYPSNPNSSLPWNQLPDLPIAGGLFKTIPIYEQLGRAKEAVGQLAGRCFAIPNLEVLSNSLTLQEAKDACAIDDILIGDDELFEAFSDSKLDAEISWQAKEVLRYQEALWTGYNYLKNDGQFHPDYFVNLYQIVKDSEEGFRPDFSRTFIRIERNGSDAEKPVYTPPRGDGIVQEKMNNLIHFLNDDSNSMAEPLLKMAIAHFQFEAIHPFRNGNGRMGRLMNIHILTQAGLLELPILNLSRYIFEHKEEYYEGLAGVSQNGDWQNWLLFMLRAVESSANRTYQKVNAIIASKEKFLEEIRDRSSIRKPEKLVEVLFSQPYCKVNHLTTAGIYAENTARNYLNELADLHMLEKRQIKGKHYYKLAELGFGD